MKNSILMVLFVSLIGASSLMAQHRSHPPRMFELTDEIKTELALTAEQSTALEALQAKTKAAADAVHSNENLEREERREAMRKIHEDAKAQMKDILSEEQLTQLREIGKAKREEHRALRESVDRKAMREEMRDYRDANIKPVMDAQRTKLESALSTTDKAALAEFRVTLAAAKEAARAERQQARESHKADGEEAAPKREGRGHGKHGRHHGPKHGKHGLQEKHPEIYSQLEAMVERYDADITRLLDEVTGQEEQWKADQKAIMERHVPAELREKHQGHREHHGDRAAHAERKELGRKIHFLLQEPSAENEKTAQNDPSLTSASIYPNPAVNTTTLTFELAEATVVRIDLRDEKGNLVKNITRDSYTTGKNQVQVELGDLVNGTYYLVLNSRTFQAPQSIRLVVVK